MHGSGAEWPSCPGHTVFLENSYLSASAGEQLQALRAIEMLETVRTPQAQQLLGELAKGAPEVRLTQEAKASLERLAKPPTTRAFCSWL